jgi:Ca2+-binding RTX toxin-like protein
VTNPVQFFGGPGVDVVQGGAGNDILVGGGGVDVLSGGAGRNLLIGGAGSDVVVGSASDDILIAGSTAFDNDPAALARIMAEWTSSRSYTQRVNNLRNVSPTADRLNGSTFLIADTTVFDDAAVDVLTGNAGQDWFLFNNDKGVRDIATDDAKNEVISDLDLLPH